MKSFRRVLVSLVALGISSPLLAAGPPSSRPPSDDEMQRIQDSIATLTELAQAPDDNVPQFLIERAEAIVVIPSLVKGGFIVGAKHGRGVMSARDPLSRAWSVPIFVTMTGGSIGWQIGLQSVDLVLLIMNRRGVDSLLDDKFTIGADLSVAAGPVGRNAAASTDAKVTSQILAYSRARGLFAGATLEGASLHPDTDANASFYGPTARVRALLTQTTVAPKLPAVVAQWRATLDSVDTAIPDRRPSSTAPADPGVKR